MLAFFGGGGGEWFEGRGEVAITNDVMKFRKVRYCNLKFEFESSDIVIWLSYIYLIIDGKISFINKKVFKNLRN